MRSFTGFGDSGDLEGSDFPAGRGDFNAGLRTDLVGESAGFTSFGAGLAGLAGFGGFGRMTEIGSSSLEGRLLLSESVGAKGSRREGARSTALEDVLYMRQRVAGLFCSFSERGSGWTDSSLGWPAGSLETMEIMSKMESSLSFPVYVTRMGILSPVRCR